MTQKEQTGELSNTGAGFTIIELLVVIVIIGILLAITTVAYNGITRQAKEASLKSDLKNASMQVELANVESGSYPVNEAAIDGGLKASPNNALSYAGSENAFCVTATNSQANLTFSITQDGTISEGACPLQFFTSASCPSERTLAVDARDNRTYWIQKLADGNCWMLTNLAYAGGGNNVYGDVKSIVNGTSDPALTFTEARYYVSSYANPTTYPQLPTTATDGGANTATKQYGYHYNWCAAMGNQQDTSACLEAVSPLPSTSVSICPAGWRLPTYSPTNEFRNLNNTVNSGSITSDAGILAAPWLGQRSGGWRGTEGFAYQRHYGLYWSSAQFNGTSSRYLGFHSGSVSPDNWGNTGKPVGQTVRCVAK